MLLGLASGGVSLLVKAVATVPPPSRASSLPRVAWVAAISRYITDQLWEQPSSMRCLITPNTPVARELAPARLRSSRKTGRCTVPDETLWLGWGRFAAQREQAPSPREVNSQEIFRLPLVPLQGIQKALSLSGRLPNLDVPGQCDSPVGATVLDGLFSHRLREQAPTGFSASTNFMCTQFLVGAS